MKKLKLKEKLNYAIINKQVFKFLSVAKILKFTKKYNGLSDEDVINLFVGLMNLVKNIASEKAEIYYRNKLNSFSREISLKSQKVIRLEAELKNLKKNKI